MRKGLVAVVALLAVSLSGCIWEVDDARHGYDFNGLWSFALTGCQAQSANAEIFQDGTAFTMLSGGYEFGGVCDPFAATFQARTDGIWGFWTFAGGATGNNTMDGTYVYVEYGVGECTGRFTANRISYRDAGAPAGPGLERKR